MGPSMEGIRRRTALQYAGILGGGSVAGCLGTDSVDYEVFQLGGSQTKPLWDWPDTDRLGYLTTLAEDDEFWMVENPETIEGFDEWYGATDFEESVLLYIASVGLDACYDELDVETVDREGNRLTGATTVVDTSGDDEACAEAITYPAAFIRASGDDLPSEATFTVTSGWGNKAIVTTEDRLLDPSNLPGLIQPSTEPKTLPDELDCENPNFERHYDPVDDEALSWGDVENEGEPIAALRVQNPQDDDDETNRLEFEQGDELMVILTNVTDGMVGTGNKNSYSLQVQTTAGWQDVRGWADGQERGDTEKAISHPPGTVFEWTFRLTEDGVLAGHVDKDSLTVCPSLPEGRYRFVFWGLVDQSVGVAFDYLG